VSRRARHLSLSLVALAAGSAIAFAVAAAAPVDAAAPQTASFTAIDFAWEVTGSTDNTATITAGGTVTFGYPSGGSAHNVDFASGPSPTSCTQTTGLNTGGAVPPLPTVPTVPAWSGTCRFNTPGTYTFVCDMHPLMMTGAVVVEAPSTTTGTTTTSATTTTGSGPTATSPGAAAPGSGSSAPRVTVARRQRGTVLRGAVTTPAGASQIVVTAFISNRALAQHRPKHVRRVRVGSRIRRSTGTGTTSFTVALNAAARRALHRRHRVDVTLRIVVTPPDGHAVTKTIAVVLRDR
jgi:plastocyanin